jgi:hypothetical protein
LSRHAPTLRLRRVPEKHAPSCTGYERRSSSRRPDWTSIPSTPLSPQFLRKPRPSRCRKRRGGRVRHAQRAREGRVARISETSHFLRAGEGGTARLVGRCGEPDSPAEAAATLARRLRDPTPGATGRAWPDVVWRG